MTSLEIFTSIYDAIKDRLNSAGFPPEKSGLDTACRSDVQSFFLPCTNRNQREWAFFRSHGMTDVEISRFAIDPAAYEATLLPPARVLGFSSRTANRASVQSPEALAWCQIASNRDPLSRPILTPLGREASAEG